MGHTSIEFDISGPFTFHSPFENPNFWFRRLDEFWDVGSGAREREPLPLTIRFRFPVVGWGSVGLCIPGTLRERRGSRMDARARSWRSPHILGSCLAPTRVGEKAENWSRIANRTIQLSRILKGGRRCPRTRSEERRSQQAWNGGRVGREMWDISDRRPKNWILSNSTCPLLCSTDTTTQSSHTMVPTPNA